MLQFRKIFKEGYLENIKILLVEDDDCTASYLYDYLIDCTFEVTTVSTVTDGISYIKNKKYDILLLDLTLPDFSGFDLLKSIKNHYSLPIIITSAFSETKIKVQAFKYGASDYMVKPIDLEELEARIWALLGRNSFINIEENKGIFRVEQNTIFFKQKQLNLTAIEYDVLLLLLENKNQTLSREKLSDSLSSISSHRSLDHHIKNIRKKIEDNGTNPSYLKTEYGVGYRLVF